MELRLRNPHSVRAAIEFRPRDVISLRMKDEASSLWKPIEDLARKNKIRIEKVGGDRRQFESSKGNRASDVRSGGRNDGRGADSRIEMRTVGHIEGGQDYGRESSYEAIVKAKEPVAFEDWFSIGNHSVSVKKEVSRNATEDESKSTGLWLALDCVQDPQNVGSIFRTASFFGVKGILFTKDRSSALSHTVYDVSAGGVESVPFCQVTNLARAISDLKEKGAWILGTSEHAKTSFRDVKPDRNWVLVLGNEESGMRRLTQELADVTCTIPLSGTQGGVSSLNVSVAAGLLMGQLSV